MSLVPQDASDGDSAKAAAQNLAASSEHLVILGLSAQSGAEAIDALAARLVQSGRVSDHELFVTDVRKREAQVSTELPWNLAIPHARSNAVKKFAIAIGRSDEGFFWNSESEEPTRLVIMLAAPGDQEGNDYMVVLSELATALLDDDFRESLMASESAAELISAVERRVHLD